MSAYSNKGSRRSYLVYGTAIFFAAFLLFQMELIIAKYILPWFGGSPSVWTTCMLVFQVLLLAGYLYAHLLSTRLPFQSHTRLHIFLLCITFIVMSGFAFVWPSPLTPGAAWKPEGTADPVIQIISLLAISVGLPFFVLASTSPLLQAWHGRTGGSSTYRLYSISNAGSLLGLLSYPFIIEPNFTINQQAWLWFIGYAAFSVLCIASALTQNRVEKIPKPKKSKKMKTPTDQDDHLSIGRSVLWLLLPACACSMFLATTNMLCQEISVIPFLWVLPLTIYLFSFIACFYSSRLYKRSIFHPLYLISVVFVLTAGKTSILEPVGSYSLALFAVAMILHGELARLKPSSRYLTSFYLMIAAGGALGGVFVALVAPLIFTGFWEFQLCLFSCGILTGIILFREKKSWLHQGSYWLPFIIVVGLAAAYEASLHLRPSLFASLPSKNYLYISFGAAGLFAIWPIFNRRNSIYRSRWIKAYAFIALFLIGGTCVLHAQSKVADTTYRFRSFFGVFRIRELGSNLVLKHGQTIHGWQIQDGQNDRVPTCYFSTNTGIGILLLNHPKQKMVGLESELRVGIIGLGSGTLATYGRIQDYYRFYEIDPKIARISQGPQAIFTFLRISEAKTEVVLGDGRLSLEREAKRGDFGRFDVLILDAFSSDSIPTHLLTREAMELYLQHLRGDDSIIAFHISNRLLDLAPVILGLSRWFNMKMIIIDTPEGQLNAPTRWVFLSQDPKAFRIPQLERVALHPLDSAHSILWTDNYSNLFQVVMNWTSR